MAPPNGFLDLSAAYNATQNEFVSIIGVVVDLMTPTLTRSGEHMLSFKLLDERLRDSVYGSQGLLVRFFKKDLQSLPRVSQRGDVVLLRNIKVTSFNGQPIALSNYQTSTLVFPAASIPEPSYQISFQDKRRIECLGVPMDKGKLSLEEQRYVIELKQELSSTVESLPALRLPVAPAYPPVPAKRHGETLASTDSKKQRQSSFGLKFRQVSEIRHLEFADICGQVVKKFPTHFGTCELYVTDYTQNKDMFYYAPPEMESESERDGDQFGYSGPPKRSWPGPWGWLVLKVNLKDPHAYYANSQVNEGDLVLLRNVKMKMRNEGAKLEGDMWPDDLNPEKVKVVKIRAGFNSDTPELMELSERKNRYWAARESNAKQREAQQQKITHTERKKRKKQRKAEKEATAAAPRCDNVRDVEDLKSKQIGTTSGQTKADINPHVRCGHEEVPISSIRHILDSENERHTNATPDGMIYVMPFVDAKLRARVRVVDFEPKQLENFALPESVPDGDTSDASMIIDYDSSAKYEWSFSLLLEDASKTKSSDDAENSIWVNLGHEEAQYLFGNNVKDPTNLRHDHQLLIKLKEQLCILWGNLEEKAADDPISNRPFECCLMEYGIEMEDDDPEKVSTPFGFKRSYRMFGVTIL